MKVAGALPMVDDSIDTVRRPPPDYGGRHGGRHGARHGEKRRGRVKQQLEGRKPMIHGSDSWGRNPRPRQHRRGGNPRPNPTSTGRRLKRNVRVGGRRTTIVLEAYVWDSIDAMLHNEGVLLDQFCAEVENLRRHSSMASSARLVVLAYFRLLQQINSPPFVDPDLEQLRREGLLRAPQQQGPPVPMLQVALRRFAQDEARAG